MSAIERSPTWRVREWAWRTTEFGRVGWLLVFGAADYVAIQSAKGFGFNPSSASPFWFPDSILLVALLRTRPRDWWAFVAVTLPIRLFAESARDIPLWFLAVSFAIDAAMGLITAGVLR